MTSARAGAAREGARYVLAVAALWLAFSLRSGGDHFGYGRLAAPLVPALIAMGVAGLLDLVASRRRAWAPAVAAALALAVALRAWSHAIPPQHGFDNVRRWSRLGVALRQRFPGANLATVPIGAIGFYARSRVIDLVGLTEPHIARHGQRLPVRLVRRQWLGHERYDTAWALFVRQGAALPPAAAGPHD